MFLTRGAEGETNLQMLQLFLPISPCVLVLSVIWGMFERDAWTAITPSPFPFFRW